jgi:eukaryotic-like serine/threonine-protein kinase
MNIFKRSIFLNLIIMSLITVGLLFAFFQSLNGITKHGQEAVIPNVTGESLTTAMQKLQGFELQIDSIYQPYSKKLEIIYQEPVSGSIVKKGRTVFLTVNKIAPPTITMPDLVNMSFRNAILTLQSYRLVMGDTIFRADIAAGAVLAQIYNGKEISRGSQIPIGSRVNLIVGAGLSDSIINVPNMIGMNYAQARSMMEGIGVTTTIVWDGSITDSNAAIIYKQFPESKNELEFGNTIAPGDLMDLYIMQRPSAELLRLNQPGAARYLDPNDTSARITYGPPTTTLPGEEIPDSLKPKTPTTTTSGDAKPKPRKPRPAAINGDKDPVSNPDVNNDAPTDIIGTKANVDPANTDVSAPRVPKVEEPVNKRADEKGRIVTKEAPKATTKKVEVKKPEVKKLEVKKPEPKKSESKKVGVVKSGKVPDKKPVTAPAKPKKPASTIKKNSDTENEFR